VSICLSICGDKQGRAGQGGQGRHPPTGPVGGPQQPSGWSSCSANVFFLLSSLAYVTRIFLKKKIETK